MGKQGEIAKRGKDGLEKKPAFGRGEAECVLRIAIKKTLLRKMSASPAQKTFKKWTMEGKSTASRESIGKGKG